MPVWPIGNHLQRTTMSFKPRSHARRIIPSLRLLWLLLLELSRETLVFCSWLPSSCNFPFSLLLMMQRRLCCIGLQLSSMLWCTLCCTQLYPALMMRCILCCTWWQPVLMTSARYQLKTQLLLRKACTFNRVPVIPQAPGRDSEDFPSNGPPIFFNINIYIGINFNNFLL